MGENSQRHVQLVSVDYEIGNDVGCACALPWPAAKPSTKGTTPLQSPSLASAAAKLMGADNSDAGGDCVFVVPSLAKKNMDQKCPPSITIHGPNTFDGDILAAPPIMGIPVSDTSKDLPCHDMEKVELELKPENKSTP